MKKTVLIFSMALLIALPIFSLADELTATPAAEVLTTQPYGFTDANDDGICDICGNEQGKNAEAPGFTDADSDGTCDHFGTNLQGQGLGQQGQGRGQNTQGKGVQGAAQGSYYVDADNNGVCDNLNTSSQRNSRGGRNRR